jgi:hypothetical protein
MWKILAKTSPEKTLYEHIVDVLAVLSQMIEIFPGSSSKDWLC